jgi:hypothetical protein
MSHCDGLKHGKAPGYARFQRAGFRSWSAGGSPHASGVRIQALSRGEEKSRIGNFPLCGGRATSHTGAYRSRIE